MAAEKGKRKPNKKQQDCIDNIQGKYLVLAGPGTGKTFTIIERIKNMLKKGIEPEKILCLTFTDAACNEMKKRIEEEISAGCDVQIFTYHGFCCNIIEEYQEKFEIPSNYKVISDPVSKAFITECIEEIQPVYFRTEKNDPYFYINKIKSRIDSIKQNRMTKEQFFENLEDNPDWEPEKKRLEDKIEEKIKKGRTDYKGDKASLESITKRINQAHELWDFYELYQKKMDKERYLDFNDMINLVLNKFEKDAAFLNEVANRYEYLMVDEYQDTNKSQNEIVFALTKALETQNVFVVGDDDQIIYRFQGAKLDTIENYLEEFPDTKIICLTENMRSTQSILDVAMAVIAQDPLSLVNTHNYKDKDGEKVTKILKAKNDEINAKNKPVRFYKYADIMQEYLEIVQEINELVHSDECPVSPDTGEKDYSQIAILTRTNEQAQKYAELLKLKNIPYELKEGKDIFSIPAVNVLYFYIQFLVNPAMHSFRIFQLLTAEPFCIDPKDYTILFNEVSKEKTFIDVLRKGEWGKYKNADKLKNFLETYDYLTSYKSRENIKNTILEIGARTGIFNHYINGDADSVNRAESIAGLKKFVDEAEGFSDIYRTSFLEEFYTYLKYIIEDEETIKTDKAPVTLNAVQLCTYHSSKGREFEYVYMPTLETYKWERSPKSLKPEIPVPLSEYKTDDEIKNEIKPSDLTKLMYVAITRAKHTLRMSYPAEDNRKLRQPTKFLYNIQDMFQKENEPFIYTEESFWGVVKRTLDKAEHNDRMDFEELIRAKIGNRVYSPSSINRYLACPRQYLYGDILELKPKDGNPNYLSYGLAVHKACEDGFRFLRDKKVPPEKEQFIKWFKDELAGLPMESYQQREVFEGRGIKALEKYYAQLCNTAPGEIVDVEQKLEVVLEDGITFYGKIDRIDRCEDGTYTIYDYKTGNNKNGDIKPGGDHEDYFNQMAWYKYFYELKTGKKIAKTKFIYPEDFESTNNGINYTEADMKTVVEKFMNSVRSIKNLEFDPSYNDNACKYCCYKDYCSMN